MFQIWFEQDLDKFKYDLNFIEIKFKYDLNITTIGNMMFIDV